MPAGSSLDGPAHRLPRLYSSARRQPDHERLGGAILAGQAAYAQTGAFPELLSIYHLLAFIRERDAGDGDVVGW